MNQTNYELKNRLFSQIEILGKKQSLFPLSETYIDETIRELERFNPINQPLRLDNLASLVGKWHLAYASNVTAITRPIAEITNILGSGIKIKKIWQSINNLEGEIIASNHALVELPLLGEYELSAEGTWRSQQDEQTAIVNFNFFSLQAIDFFGQSDWIMPELQIPILEFFRNEAVWITSYLDEDTRIGRGKTGNLFVFHR